MSSLSVTGASVPFLAGNRKKSDSYLEAVIGQEIFNFSGDCLSGENETVEIIYFFGTHRADNRHDALIDEFLFSKRFNLLCNELSDM